LNEPPAGLYLHVPFCSQVCPYCDFAVRTGDAARRRRYVDHLLQEIELYTGYPLEFDTIYFGGGTPSSLEPADLERIIGDVRRQLNVAGSSRIFLEANPEDADAARLADWKRLGVETLSLGVQSFDAASLKFLGRRHDPQRARQSVEQARQAGFATVAIDLIYGLPGQSAADWRQQLEAALEIGVDHLSCYQLTIHERTRFGLLAKRGKLVQLPQDSQAELFHLTHRFLADAGMQGYEVSQFAAGPEHRSRHNMKYWNHTPYLGLGPSAHSYEGDRRWWNLRRTDDYQDCVRDGRRPVEEEESLDAQALVLEALMTGLRTYAGVDLRVVEQRWGIDLLSRNRSLVERLVSGGFAEFDGTRLAPTLDGLAIADSLAPRFDLG